MADYSGFMPLSPQAGGQPKTLNKMPGAVPNGTPPQWGQMQDRQSFPSQGVGSNLNATNGRHLHHGHPGSLSSHSSRDSSPAPSRMGMVNHSHTPPPGPGQYQHPSPVPGSGAGSGPPPPFLQGNQVSPAPLQPQELLQRVQPPNSQLPGHSNLRQNFSQNSAVLSSQSLSNSSSNSIGHGMSLPPQIGPPGPKLANSTMSPQSVPTQFNPSPQAPSLRPPEPVNHMVSHHNRPTMPPSALNPPKGVPPQPQPMAAQMMPPRPMPLGQAPPPQQRPPPFGPNPLLQNHQPAPMQNQGPPRIGPPPGQSLSGPTQPRPQFQQPPLQANPVAAPSPTQYMPGQLATPQKPYGSMPPGPTMPPNDPGLINARRYPQQPSYPPNIENLTQPMGNLNISQMGYNRIWGQESYDLLQNRNILPPEKLKPPQIRLVADFQNSNNCSPDIFRCTLTKIPETDSLLKKSRLPLGVLIQPFRDLNNLAVIQSPTIVRCRACRTYINPFVYFMDEKHWKCNLCFRLNELPNEFHFDPVTQSYGEPTRRPEIKSATIEFIAPSEYMLRPPQPAVYLFLLDVSRFAVDSGYLQLVCEVILSKLDHLPGDGRTAVGFITFDSSVHFYSLAEGLSAPQQMIVMDIDDMFLPCPDNLLANLKERYDLIRDLLQLLPSKFAESYDTGCALGAALQAAFKLMSPTGGRVTVFQCCLPNIGPGALQPREDPTNRSAKDIAHLNPATDFYKKLALDFSGQQIAVDLFVLNQQYSDLATVSGISRFSGGCMYHFPLFQIGNLQLADSLENALRRYLERKIGFEAVMRIRCSKGLSIHTFHGNFFVRSTDLLSLPNVNPDAGFGMQLSIEENLNDLQCVCFQAALLYTSSRGERRIRVHTLCLPIAASLTDVLHSADQECIVGLLAKMAVDRSQQSSVSDARDAFVNVAVDALSAFKLTQSCSASGGLVAPNSLRLLPLYILALLKNVAFRSGTNTRLDDRIFAMCQMKTLPLANLIQFIYPDLYRVDTIDKCEEIDVEGVPIALPSILHLSSEKLDAHGAFLMDTGDCLYLLVCRGVSPLFCENVLGVSGFGAIPEEMFDLPEIDCEESRKLRTLITYLLDLKPYPATVQVIREDSKLRAKFFERLIEDRSESALSYYEFLQHIKSQIK